MEKQPKTFRLTGSGVEEQDLFVADWTSRVALFDASDLEEAFLDSLLSRPSRFRLSPGLGETKRGKAASAGSGNGGTASEEE